MGPARGGMLGLTMERGSLRPVPLSPPGPVEPAQAVAHVASALPDLDDDARRALALVEIAGRSRTEVGAELSLDRRRLAEALHRARKALRRSIFPLAANGWCERAERLLSDRLDGVLEAPGPARLDAHLRHCGRCVEHERRLAQARDGLIRGFIEAYGPAPEPEPEPAPEPPRLEAVPEPAEEPAAIAPAEEPAAIEPAEEPAAIEPAVIQPAVESPAVEVPEEPQAAPAATVAPAQAIEVPPEHTRVLAAHRSVLWSGLHVAAIALAVVSAILTVLAATGVLERVF